MIDSYLKVVLERRVSEFVETQAKFVLEMAEQLVIDPPVIETAERLFFAVRPHLQATGWVEHGVIEPIGANHPDLAVKLGAAFHGGPAVAKALLDADDAVPLDAAKRLSKEGTMLWVRFRQALAEPLDSERSKLKYLDLYVDHRHREQRLDLARQRFVQQCIVENQRCDASRRRLERADRRDLQQERKRQRRAEETRQMNEFQSAIQRERAVLIQRQQQRRDMDTADRLAASPLAQLTWVAKPRPQIQRRVA